MGYYAEAHLDWMLDNHKLFYDRRRSKQKKRKNVLAKDQTIVIRGTVDWCKLTGAPRPYTGNPKFDKGPLWSVDLTPDKDGLKKIEAAGISDKLRSDKPDAKHARKAKFLTLNVLRDKADGTKNTPPAITDGAGKKWDDDTLIGNGSVVDVMINVKDYGTTVGAYYRKMRVLEHVPYGGADFEPLSEDDKFFASASQTAAGPADDKASKAFDADLDDDVPF